MHVVKNIKYKEFKGAKLMKKRKGMHRRDFIKVSTLGVAGVGAII